MGLKACEIILDNNWGSYYVGQTVTGRIELMVDSPKKVRGITILFKGEGNTSWYIEESRTNDDGKQENERIELVGTEEYFKIQYYLIGGEGNEIIIPPGQHTYPFTCVLPPTLPSSFEGEYGYIRYTIKVTLDRPWKFDQDVKRAFTVLSPVDLNLNTRLREPARITLEKYFCCCWCKSGPLTCVVSIPCTGYVPGQIIPIVAEVDNISNIELNGVQFKLQKVITYNSQRPRREVKKDIKTISELKIGPVIAHGSNTWNQPLQVPSLPPSNLTNCGLIDLDYELHIEASVSGFHTNMKSKIPITIGTVPLSITATAPTPDSAVVNMVGSPDGSINQGVNNMGWVAGNNMYPALPTFTASEFGTNSIQEKGDNEHTMYWNNNQKYSPMYPVYKFTNNPPE